MQRLGHHRSLRRSAEQGRLRQPGQNAARTEHHCGVLAVEEREPEGKGEGARGGGGARIMAGTLPKHLARILAGFLVAAVVAGITLQIMRFIDGQLQYLVKGAVPCSFYVPPGSTI